MQELLEAVREAKPAFVIEALARLKPRTSDDAMGTSFRSVAEVVMALAATQWKLFESIQTLHDDRSVAAKSLIGRLMQAIQTDQHASALEPVLRIEQSKAIDLLASTPPRPEPPVSPPVSPPIVPPLPSAPKGKRVVDSGTRSDLTVETAEAELARLRQKIKSVQSARINVSWVIEE